MHITSFLTLPSLPFPGRACDGSGRKRKAFCSTTFLTLSLPLTRETLRKFVYTFILSTAFINSSRFETDNRALKQVTPADEDWRGGKRQDECRLLRPCHVTAL